MEVDRLVLAFETVIDQTDTSRHVIGMNGMATGYLYIMFLIFVY